MSRITAFACVTMAGSGAPMDTSLFSFFRNRGLREKNKKNIEDSSNVTCIIGITRRCWWNINIYFSCHIVSRLAVFVYSLKCALPLVLSSYLPWIVHASAIKKNVKKGGGTLNELG